MKLEYRIPDISEFKQGFKFERRNDYKFGVLDFSEGGEYKELQSYSNWSPVEVTWMSDPEELFTEQYGEYEITVTGGVRNLFIPFNIESFLKQGLIRVKI